MRTTGNAIPTNRRPEKISAVVITLNEACNIGRCLASLKGIADEAIVVDGGSRDCTRDIAAACGATVILRPFNGFSAQKNYGIREASFEKILSLDADEALSERLKASILQVKQYWRKDAYLINRLTSFEGKWIRHGEWYPDRSIRLFDREKACWEGDLHERIRLDKNTSTGRLEGCLLHYSYRSRFHFYRKTSLYTTIAAEILYRKQFKPGLYHFFLKPGYRFFHAFVIRLGFLDGKAGWQIAKLTAGRMRVQYAKLERLWEENQRREK